MTCASLAGVFAGKSLGTGAMDLRALHRTAGIHGEPATGAAGELRLEGKCWREVDVLKSAGYLNHVTVSASTGVLPILEKSDTIIIGTY
jgi:hypothetical protein